MNAAVTSRLTLADVLAGHARARPDRVALGDGDVHLTWPELRRAARSSRARSAADGVGPGDRVLWLGQNSFRLQELLLACSKLGAGFCPANWRQTPDELAFVIDDLAPRVVVVAGGRGRRERRAPDATRRSPAARRAGWCTTSTTADSYESYLAAGSPRPLRTTTPAATPRSCSSTPRRSAAGPTPRCSATAR